MEGGSSAGIRGGGEQRTLAHSSYHAAPVEPTNPRHGGVKRVVFESSLMVGAASE